MNQIKSLAGQTAVYGVSSILGRLINYLLVPLHTKLFAANELGEVAFFYAMAAFLLIMFTHGMETTYFRFATGKNAVSNPFDHALTSVLLISLSMAAVIVWQSDNLAILFEYPDHGYILRWLAVILVIDALTSIPFAKMRLENQAKRFATYKLINIGLNIILQLFFLILVPSMIMDSNPSQANVWLSGVPDIGIGFIFLANLLANIVLILLMLRYFVRAKLVFTRPVIKVMYLYAGPLLLTGVAGWTTEQLDKVLIKTLLEERDLGIYAQTFKLALLIQLSVQAFRYAGEPFFFSKYQQDDAPELFADVLYYFIAFATFVFVAVSFNIDLVANLLLQRPEYRVALYLVPIIMMGKLFYGMYINVSIWYKLKDRTIFGTYFTLIGAAVSILGNLLLIPWIGLLGSALTVLLVYVSMTFSCLLIGRRYFPVPYRWRGPIIYIVVSSLLVWVSYEIKLDNVVYDYSMNILATILFGIVIWAIERGGLKVKKVEND